MGSTSTASPTCSTGSAAATAIARARSGSCGTAGSARTAPTALVLVLASRSQRSRSCSRAGHSGRWSWRRRGARFAVVPLSSCSRTRAPEGLGTAFHGTAGRREIAVAAVLAGGDRRAVRSCLARTGRRRARRGGGAGARRAPAARWPHRRRVRRRHRARRGRVPRDGGAALSVRAAPLRTQRRDAGADGAVRHLRGGGHGRRPRRRSPSPSGTRPARAPSPAARPRVGGTAASAGRATIAWAFFSPDAGEPHQLDHGSPVEVDPLAGRERLLGGERGPGGDERRAAMTVRARALTAAPRPSRCRSAAAPGTERAASRSRGSGACSSRPGRRRGRG